MLPYVAVGPLQSDFLKFCEMILDYPDGPSTHKGPYKERQEIRELSSKRCDKGNKKLV